MDGVRSRVRALVRSSPSPQSSRIQSRLLLLVKLGGVLLWIRLGIGFSFKGRIILIDMSGPWRGLHYFTCTRGTKIFSIFFCLRNKEPADLERVMSIYCMMMLLTSGFTHDVKDVKETPRHTGPHFAANQTQFMIDIGTFECLYQKIFWESPGLDEKPPPPTPPKWYLRRITY